jgi:hypothetical protein
MVIRFPDLVPALTDLVIQVQELCSRPRILHGIGEEDGKPISIQAHWLATASRGIGFPDNFFKG